MPTLSRTLRNAPAAYHPSHPEQAKWLLAVNKEAGRGSEHRAALAAREARDGAPLTREDFRQVYYQEVAEGAPEGDKQLAWAVGSLRASPGLARKSLG